jgi:hypothetical protein
MEFLLFLEKNRFLDKAWAAAITIPCLPFAATAVEMFSA